MLAIAAIVFFEEAWVAWSKIGGSLIADLGDPAFRAGLTAGLLVAVSLAVAAIPEGLPAIVTVSLSLGVRKMAERHAIVRKLHAVETLGSTTFICSDKTGTLTKNEMAVRRLLVGLDDVSVTSENGLEPAEVAPNADDLALAARDGRGQQRRADHCGRRAGRRSDRDRAPGRREAARPRSPAAQARFGGAVRLRAQADDHGPQRRRHAIAYTKGGADVVLALCTHARLRGEVVPLSEEIREAISAANSEPCRIRLPHARVRDARCARRTARPSDSADLERDLTYVGILGLVDPPRDEVRDAIAECHRAGIHVAMVTGDHALTARAIAADIGLLDTDRVVTGQELEAMSDDELAEQVRDIRVYARVNPEHKLRIVDALKRNGEVVAMTGDGVNDAPALKRADIGIAMGKVGTDVAREAADMVLSDDNFATIVHAVEQGRVVFDNLRKVILFLLSCNMSEVLVVFVTALFSPSAALLPLQLLWINLVTDGLPALALGVDPGDAGVMDRMPRNADESILSRQRNIQILWQGTVMTGACLVLYYLVAPQLPGMTPNIDRTMLFTALVLTQLLHAFNFRSQTESVWNTRSFANRWLVAGLVGSMALQCAVIYLPGAQSVFKTAALSPIHWLAVIVASAVAIAILDAAKLLTAARSRANSKGATS